MPFTIAAGFAAGELAGGSTAVTWLQTADRYQGEEQRIRGTNPTPGMFLLSSMKPACVLPS